MHRHVSIHAPTRGATIYPTLITSSGNVSIHAPTRGATPSAFGTSQFCDRFNPRPHAGGDGCVDLSVHLTA